MAYLEMIGITKRFGDFTANDHVNLSVKEGEIHALLGENGAGKSTLMNVLYGMYASFEGEILLKGLPVEIKNPKQAIEYGIGMVHQHFMLIPALTVIENVVLGMSENSAVLDLKAAAKKFEELAKRYDIIMDPWVKVSSLSVGQQQRLEILKALYRGSKLLILDEPTAVLTPQETYRLFGTMKKMTDHGMTIIFITHKLGEIMDLCDSCTILRQGKVVKRTEICKVKDKSILASWMVGKDVNLHLEKGQVTPGAVVLDVKHLNYTDKQGVHRLKNISLHIREGEILGICGVDGNGQSELIRCITHLLPLEKGKIFISGEDCTQGTPGELLQKGVSHIPEDRHKMAVINDMSIHENMILMDYRSRNCSSRGFLNWKWIKKRNQSLCQQYDVRYKNLEEPIADLSGGNQQKVVVAREMDRKPKLLIAVHPDRGLDIGASKFIQSKILEAREAGAAVLLVSTELEEVMELSDRIAVLYEGEITGILTQKEAKRDKLGQLMAGIR